MPNEENFSFGTSFLEITKNEPQEAETKSFEKLVLSLEEKEAKEKVKNEIKKGKPLKSFEKFYNDKEVVLTAVKYDQNALHNASKELQNDIEVVLASVQSFGSSLQYASPELRNDFEIAHLILQKNGKNLEYFSKEIRNHELLTYVAIIHEPLALKFAINKKEKIYCPMCS